MTRWVAVASCKFLKMKPDMSGFLNKKSIFMLSKEHVKMFDGEAWIGTGALTTLDSGSKKSATCNRFSCARTVSRFKFPGLPAEAAVGTKFTVTESKKNFRKVFDELIASKNPVIAVEDDKSGDIWYWNLTLAKGTKNKMRNEEQQERYRRKEEQKKHKHLEATASSDRTSGNLPSNESLTNPGQGGGAADRIPLSQGAVLEESDQRPSNSDYMLA